MFITPSFKKSLIVEQFQGNYLKEFGRLSKRSKLLLLDNKSACVWWFLNPLFCSWRPSFKRILVRVTHNCEIFVFLAATLFWSNVSSREDQFIVQTIFHALNNTPTNSNKLIYWNDYENSDNGH